MDIIAMLLNSHVHLQLEYMKLFRIEPLNQMVNTVAEVKFTLTPFHRCTDGKRPRDTGVVPFFGVSFHLVLHSLRRIGGSGSSVAFQLLGSGLTEC